MKVLILSHIFWPENADFKNMSLAKELVASGHEVTVLTAFPNYPLGRLYDGYKMSWRQWEYVDEIKILRVPLFPDHSSSGLKRMLNYGSFTLSTATIGLILAGRFDVMFVHSPPMTLGLTAGLFKLFYRIPILLDVVDLWPDAIAGSGMVSSQLVIRGTGWLAKISYRLADKITVLTKGYAERLESLGVPSEKISLMPPWADSNIHFPTERDHSFGEKHGLSNKFCIIHAGNVGPFQDIENILNAAVVLKNISELRIVFVGGGRDLEKYKKQKENMRLENVIFTGSYSVDKMSGILAWADGLLVSLLPDPYLAINLPSKVPAYMATGRPIIACAEGETSRLVSDFSMGICCQPGNPGSLANALIALMECTPLERDEMGKNCIQTFEKYYNKDLLIGKYISMLETLGVSEHAATSTKSGDPGRK